MLGRQSGEEGGPGDRVAAGHPSGLRAQPLAAVQSLVLVTHFILREIPPVNQELQTGDNLYD